MCGLNAGPGLKPRAAFTGNFVFMIFRFKGPRKGLVPGRTLSQDGVTDSVPLLSSSTTRYSGNLVSLTVTGTSRPREGWPQRRGELMPLHTAEGPGEGMGES